MVDRAGGAHYNDDSAMMLGSQPLMDGEQLT